MEEGYAKRVDDEKQDEETLWRKSLQRRYNFGGGA